MQFLTLSLFCMSAASADEATPKFEDAPKCKKEELEDCTSTKVVDQSTDDETEKGRKGNLDFCWKKLEGKKPVEKCEIEKSAETEKKAHSAEEKTKAAAKCQQCKKSAAAYTGAFLGLVALLI